MEPYPHQFATALFSFLYHLASYDAGGEALVSCGMMEALLKVYPDPTNCQVVKKQKWCFSNTYIHLFQKAFIS